MKIGILTFVHAFNYGAELQAFALQFKLRQMGYNAEVLDVFRPSDKEYIYSKESDIRFKQLYSFKSRKDIRSKIRIFLARLKENTFCLVYRKAFQRRKKEFDSFHEKYTNLSSTKYYNFLQLYKNPKMPYTHLIVGSDQIWNFTNEFSVEPYFLTFANNAKLISYAASIGHNSLPAELIPKYREWSLKFDAISLREIQGVNIMKEVTGRDDIKCVVDPTLLLNKEEWKNALSIDCHEEEPYIFIYLLSRSVFSLKIAKFISEKYNFHVKLITTDAIRFRKEKWIKYYCGVSPREFVSLYMNASFAITNSFHGTAFAINFGVPFISTTRKDKRVNSRFVNLLSKANRMNHLFYEGPSIDYDRINALVNVPNDLQIIEKERSDSLYFLQQALEN